MQVGDHFKVGGEQVVLKRPDGKVWSKFNAGEIYPVTPRSLSIVSDLIKEGKVTLITAEQAQGMAIKSDAGKVAGSFSVKTPKG